MLSYRFRRMWGQIMSFAYYQLSILSHIIIILSILAKTWSSLLMSIWCVLCYVGLFMPRLVKSNTHSKSLVQLHISVSSCTSCTLRLKKVPSTCLCVSMIFFVRVFHVKIVSCFSRLIISRIYILCFLNFSFAPGIRNLRTGPDSA